MRYAETSGEAYADIKPVLGKVDAQIVGYLSAFGPATCEQLETELGIRHQTVSAQLCHLRDRGVIEEAGEGRTSRGRRCGLYRIAKTRQRSLLDGVGAA